MRILMIANNIPWHGHRFDGAFNLAQAHALAQRGHETSIVRCVPWAPPLRSKLRRYGAVPSRYVLEGIPVRTLRAFMGPRSFGIGTLRMQLRATMAEIAAEFRPDVVHVQGLLPSGLLACDIGVPFVLTAHGSETYRLPWMRADLERAARYVVARADRAVAVSGFVADHVRRLGRSDVRVIFNGADERHFAPSDRKGARERLGFPLERPTIVYVGRVERAKGLLDFAHAVRALRELAPHIVIAGEGALRDDLTAYFQQHGIHATWLGSVGHASLGDVYASADVCVLPSYNEGLPVVVCEAMSAGRAMVASRVGGIPEIVEDGVTGLLHDAGDVLALEAALRRILTDRVVRARFEGAAYAFAQQRLTWRENARSYEALYDDLVTRRPTEPFSATHRLLYS